jgi:regulator of RNase E activity RraB
MPNHYSPWSFDAFWKKSVIYARRAQSKTDGSVSVFWSLLLLELLPRAVLAKTDPILLAETNEDIMLVFGFRHPQNENQSGQNRQKDKLQLPKPPKSIKTAKVFERCRLIMSNFSDDDKNFCNYYIDLRNRELHTGEFCPSPLPFEDDYYRIINLFVTHCEKTLEELLGEGHAKYVNQLLKDSEKRQVDELTSLIITAKESFDSLSPNEQQQKQTQASVRVERLVNAKMGNSVNKPIALQKTVKVQCPVCSSDALLKTQSVRESYETHPENENVKISLVFRPLYFSCNACDLEIYSLTKLLALSKVKNTKINKEILDKFEEMTHPIEELVEIPITDYFGTYFDNNDFDDDYFDYQDEDGERF